MIDIESVVYTRVHDAIRAEFPNCSISDDVPPEKNAVFPHVTIKEDSNRTDPHTLDNATNEHHAIVVYEISVYSNKINGRKAECKAIMQIADAEMQDMLFNRIQKHELPTVDRTIMRMYARYEAVVEEPETVDGQTVYQMYRR